MEKRVRQGLGRTTHHEGHWLFGSGGCGAGRRRCCRCSCGCWRRCLGRRRRSGEGRLSRRCNRRDGRWCFRWIDNRRCPKKRWEDIQCAQKYQQDYNHQQDCAGDSDRRLALALRHGGDGSCQILRAFPFEGADRLLWAHGMVISIWAFARSACNQSASALACRLSFASVVKGYESTCSMT